MATLYKIIAAGFGSGCVPFAPGTAGSLLALIIAWFLPDPAFPYLLILAAAFTAIGIPAGNCLEKSWGHDPSRYVADEMIGMWISLFWIPKNLVLYILAFVLFRAFDIVKPFPANRAQDLPGGIGIIADDLVAGGYALLFTHIALYWKFHLLFHS